MSAGEHAHDHARSPIGRLRVALVVSAVIALLELAGGWRAGSLALLSDAAHVAMDVVALAIALAASVQAGRPATDRQSFGFARFEILAALLNGALLSGVTVLIAVEAFRRFAEPVAPAGTLMATIAAIGLCANVAVGWMLSRGVHDDLNVRSAVLHVAGDALGAAAVLAGGAAIAVTGAAWIDPALSLFVAAIIVGGIVKIARDATHVLLESAPAHAAIPVVRGRIAAIPGVVEIHDLHVWTIGSRNHALAAHVVLEDRRISEATAVLREIEAAMRRDFEISHLTVQFECESCEPDDRIVCTQVTRAN